MLCRQEHMSFKTQDDMRRMPADVLFALWWECRTSSPEVTGVVVEASVHDASEGIPSPTYPMHSDSD
jgi:hypothetical protein